MPYDLRTIHNFGSALTSNIHTPVEIRRFSKLDETTKQKIFSLRNLVWSKDGNWPKHMQLCDDEREEKAIHWGAYVNDVLVSATRMTLHSSLADAPEADEYERELILPVTYPLAVFGRSVTHPDYAGKGIGKLVWNTQFEETQHFWNTAIGNSATPQMIHIMKSVGFQVQPYGNDDVILMMNKSHKPIMINDQQYELDIIRDRRHFEDMNSTLRQEMKAMASSHYATSPTVMDADLEHATTIYTLRDKKGLAGFFMVTLTNLEIKSNSSINNVPAFYLGLSMARADLQGKGIAGTLYSNFVKDGALAQNWVGKKIIAFGTLATPSSYHFLRLHFDDLQPREDGFFHDKFLPIVTSVRQWLKHPQTNDHSEPFILRNYTDTRYSDEERRRIASVCQKKRFHLFDRIGLREDMGDRIIFLCGIPSPQNSASRL